MRFGTSNPAGRSERAGTLRALAEDARHARQRSLTRDQSHARAWREADQPHVRSADPTRRRCPVCELFLPRAVRTCTSCLHTGHRHEPGVVNGRKLVWKKSTTGTAYKQSVASGHTDARWGVV